MGPIRIPREFYTDSLDWLAICWRADASTTGRCDIGPEVLVNILLPNLIILAGIIFFILIIYYGWQLIQHAGTEIGPQQIHRAQQAVTWSLIGFLLVVSAYFILQMVGTITGVDFLHPPL